MSSLSQSKQESSSPARSSIVRPGGLIAILGGGQLGRMTAMAARTMGYHVRVMDPEPVCPRVIQFSVEEAHSRPEDDRREAPPRRVDFRPGKRRARTE